MNQAAIDRLVDHYRRLSPDRLAVLDDERHQLSAEEATALDIVIHSHDMGGPAIRAIRNLDLHKQRRFRIGFMALILFIGISLPLNRLAESLFGSIIPMPIAAPAIAWAAAYAAAWAIYALWEQLKRRILERKGRE